MSDICGDTVGNMPRGLVGDTLGNGLHFYLGISKCIRYSIRVAEKVSNTLWAFPKESPIPFRYFSNGF
jgi:hypothetical protein